LLENTIGGEQTFKYWLRAYSPLENPPGSADKEAAWHLVTATLAAPIHELGLKFRRSQARRAAEPRGKLSDGRTLGQVIAELASRPERRNETARELCIFMMSWTS